MEFKMNLPPAVELIISRLNQHGYAAYVVGGSVRDSLIGRELGDFDITTSALPERTKELFPEYKTIDTGIRHGTVTLVIDKVPYEVTTYRIDGDYRDNRHPDSVTFTDDLREDLKRRDFTVNAMCYNSTEGLVDMFSGREDAEGRIIRAVGDPALRFEEDALRILRALRFSSVLDFDVEEETANAARDKKHLLSGVSSERIYTEIKKLILGKRPSTVLLEYSDIFSVALGGISISKMPTDERMALADYPTRLASVFLLNSPTPIEDAERVLALLKTDKRIRADVAAALTGYFECDFSSRRSVLVAMAKNGKGATDGALSLGTLTGRFEKSESDLYEELILDNPVWQISQLAIGGAEVKSAGYSGEEIGRVLSELLYSVINGECENTRESLLDRLK